MKVEFTVNGHPPKKHGEKSMWARDDEAPLVALLREKALETMSKNRINKCFACLVSLDITLFTPRSSLESIGDLDNFITGICDSLQAADLKAIPHLHRVFSLPRYRSIEPKRPLLISNDAKVVSIVAKKVLLAENENVYYRVILETIDKL
jgi:hypothetical protein